MDSGSIGLIIGPRILTVADGRAFLMDDGSGRYARVLPQDANVDLDPQYVTSGKPVDPVVMALMSPSQLETARFFEAQFEAFLAAHGLRRTPTICVYEEVIAPGDHLYALGPSRRDSRGYRMAPSSELVLFPGPEEKLILTNRSMATGRKIGFNFAVFGFTICLFMLISYVVFVVLPAIR